MSFAKVNVVVAEMVSQAKMETFEKMKVFFSDKLDEDSMEAMNQFFDEFKVNLDKQVDEEKKSSKAATKGKGKKKTTADGEKKEKKAPTAYNIFMGETVKRVRAENPGMSAKDAMGQVKILWAEHKEANGIVSKTKPKAKKAVVEVEAEVETEVESDNSEETA